MKVELCGKCRHITYVHTLEDTHCRGGRQCRKNDNKIEENSDSYLWLASCCQHSVIMDAHGQSLGTRGLSPSLATLAIICAADNPSYTSCLYVQSDFFFKSVEQNGTDEDRDVNGRIVYKSKW